MNLGSSAEKLTTNYLTIEGGLLLAGDVSYQIRNVVSLTILEVKRKGLWILCFLIAAVIGGLCLAMAQNPVAFVLGAIVGGVGAYFLLRGRFKTTFELKLMTSAATSFTVESTEYDFLVQLKSALEQEMSQKNPPVFQVNVPEQRIEKIVDNRTFISTGGGDFIGEHGTKMTAGGDILGERASKVSTGRDYVGGNAVSTGGGNYIGRDASDVSISSTVTQQASVAIETALATLQRSQDQNKDFFVFHFQVLQQYIQGQKSKGDASKSFELIKEYAGVLTTVGVNAAPLIARIAELFR